MNEGLKVQWMGPHFFFSFELSYERESDRSLGRIHPVTLWGGLALMLSFPGRMAFGKTDLWLRFAEWIVY